MGNDRGRVVRRFREYIADASPIPDLAELSFPDRARDDRVHARPGEQATEDARCHRTVSARDDQGGPFVVRQILTLEIP